MRRTACLLGLVSLALALAAARPASASPSLRWQNNQHGDFVWIGNTSAQECDPRARAPVVGTIYACGSNTADTAADVFWTTADDPNAPSPFAETSVTAGRARSTAVLALPAGATVTYARLYWGAELLTDDPDTTVTLDRLAAGVPVDLRTITADASYSVPKANADGDIYWYESTADVTAIVTAWGSGAYRLSDIASVELADFQSNDTFAAWSLVVFYQLASEPFRNLALFDGLDFVRNGSPATVTISGFQVPTDTGYDAKLGVMAFEGDTAWTGDGLIFEGNTLADAVNPADDFFNGSRSYLGNPVSVVGDLPQMDGLPNSMSGFDLDVIDVTAYVVPGQTSASMEATSSGDTYVLGAFATSIGTYEPNFGDSVKSYANLGGTAVVPGDTLEYTILVPNTGNDDALDVVLTDALPVGVTYVPGSLLITEGANAGALTDVAGDDQGEYDAATRTITVRLGEGATAAAGGTLAIGASTTVKLRVTVDSGATGTIVNQAHISARGRRGNPVTDYPTGDGTTPGVPTETPIAECDSNANCSPPEPVCNLLTHQCVQCTADTDCGGATSGRVCDQSASICINGCRGTGGNGCPGGQSCTSATSAIGTCYVPGTGGPTGTGGSDAGIDTGGTGGSYDGGMGSLDGVGGAGGARDAGRPDVPMGGPDGSVAIDGARRDVASADRGPGSGLDGAIAGLDAGTAVEVGASERPPVDDGAKDVIALADAPVVNPVPDAGADVPAGPSGGSVQGGGCSCNTLGVPVARPGWLAFLTIAVGMGLRRRKRRR
jgi:uncharacterized repeat protein (TIGR01451 family)